MIYDYEGNQPCDIFITKNHIPASRNEIPPKFRNPIPPKFNPHPPSSTPPLLSPSAETSTAGCALAGAAAGSGPTGHETVHHSTRHCRIPHLIHVQLSPWEKKDMVGRDRGRGRGRGHGRGRGRRRKGRPRLSTGHPLDLHANPYSLIRSLMRELLLGLEFRINSRCKYSF
nr:uncharacterized protein LOC112805649 [Arachis hypogaea]